jgi:hypothetical protein
MDAPYATGLVTADRRAHILQIPVKAYDFTLIDVEAFLRQGTLGIINVKSRDRTP